MKLTRIFIALFCLLGLVTSLQAQQSCNASIPASTPAPGFSDHGDGTVTHHRTGLMWKRCAEGQTLSAVACTGTASASTWAQALVLASSSGFTGQSDWRLPNVKELASIIEDRCHGPSVNQSIFPSAPASHFWSSSSVAYWSGGAWAVNFGDGGVGNYAKGDAKQVRLVRAGQSFGAFDAFDTVPLTVARTGAGHVTGGPIYCGSTCTANTARGFAVTLSALPEVNLISWGGACASAGVAPTCTLTMDAAKSVMASFQDTPILAGLPASMSFATQNVGSTSAAQSVTLTNSGTVSLTIASIAVSGDYGVTHTCGTGLGVGGFCTLTVSFSPIASGTRTGSITIDSNAPGTPHSIALTGTGQGSTSVVSPSSLSFVTQGLNTTSAVQTVTLSNTGGAVLKIASKVANGDFAISSSTCGATLAPASSCNISVTFTPTTLGTKIGSLVIASDALSSPSTVGLFGTGVAVALVSLSPATLTFAAQAVGVSSAVQTVGLANTGGAALIFTSIVGSADFALTNNCGGGLGAGGSCVLSVIFTPTMVGTRTGAVTITSNAAGSPQSVSLNGVGGVSTGTLITRYRLYSDGTKEHLYTTDANEYSVLPGRGWIAEGAIYKLFQGPGSLAGVDAVPYYRLYNPFSFQHHWSTDVNEYNVLGTLGWSQEGVDGYILPTAATGSVPLYRLYLKDYGGLHLWTTDANEKNVLSTSNGWVDEGVAGYVVPLP